MRACVIIQLQNDSDLKRIQKDVPAIMEAMRQNSTSSETVFQSNDGVLFGFFIETDVPLAKVKLDITNSTSFIGQTPSSFSKSDWGLKAQGSVVPGLGFKGIRQNEV